MEIQAVQENLEYLLRKSEGERVSAALAKFADDVWLIDRIDEFTNSQRKNIDDEGLRKLVWILETIVDKDYVIEDPIVLSSIYFAAYNGSKMDSYSAIVEHVNKMAKHGNDLINHDVSRQEGKVRDARNGVDACAPVKYGNDSYLSLVEYILNNGANLSGNLEVLEKHFAEIAKQKIDISKLVKAGYVDVLKKAIRHSTDNKSNIQDPLNSLNGVLSKIDAEGFEIYDKGSMDLLTTYAGQGKLASLNRVTKYCDKNSLILYFNLRLRKDPSEEEKQETTTK